MQTQGNSQTSFDVIVVGSGMGGLTAASILASVGNKRVLVLESHFKLGGFLHSFQRHGYVWDPGVHYVGEMESGSLTRRCMDLVTGGKVDWQQLDDSFERYLFPEATVSVPSETKGFRDELKQRFPAESANIDQYFKDLKKVQSWSYRWFYSKAFRKPISSALTAGRKLAETNTQEYLDSRFDDPLLKSVLTAQWPDYGTPPGRSAFGIHGIVATNFGNGGFYPVGGSKKIVDSATKVIEQHGGRCLAKHRVDEILIKDNKAYGVRVETRSGPQEFYAPQIVSNAGVSQTFDGMVNPTFGGVERDRLQRSEVGASSTILFMGLNDDPRNHGFENCNYWIYRELDFNSPEDRSSFPPRIDGAYLSLGSLRNPGQTPHTAQIVTFSEHATWERFEDLPWKKRGSEYQQNKELYAEQLLDFVEERVPGLRALIDYQELSTPLTIKSFTGNDDGQIYGRASTPRRVSSTDEWSISTSVKNLYLTGTDIVMPGVNSALMIGVMTAGKLLGLTGMPRVMLAAMTAETASPTHSEDTKPQRDEDLIPDR